MTGSGVRWYDMIYIHLGTTMVLMRLCRSIEWRLQIVFIPLQQRWSKCDMAEPHHECHSVVLCSTFGAQRVLLNAPRVFCLWCTAPQSDIHDAALPHTLVSVSPPQRYKHGRQYILILLPHIRIKTVMVLKGIYFLCVVDFRDEWWQRRGGWSHFRIVSMH